jgi:N-methylhydantoinase A
VRTDRVRLDEANRARIAGHLDGLAAAAAGWFAHEAVAPADRLVEVTLDIRYVGQNFELPVRLAGAGLPPLDRLRAMFFAIHEANYGYFNPDDPLEVVNFRLAARGRLKFVEPPADDRVAAGPPEHYALRPVWFTATAATPARLYARDDLLPGHEIAGPAVVEQLDTTTLIFPGDRARVDRTRNLLIEVTA